MRHRDFIDLAFANHDAIRSILFYRGLSQPRIPFEAPSWDPESYEILVTTRPGATIAGVAGAMNALDDLFGFEVDVVPETSLRGEEIGDSATPLRPIS